MNKNKMVLGADCINGKDETKVYFSKLIDGIIIYLDDDIVPLPVELIKLCEGSFEKLDKAIVD